MIIFVGLKKVTWVEHVEVDDRARSQNIFKHLICTGQAFGANRWVATLERQCERIASIISTDFQSVDCGDHISICYSVPNLFSWLFCFFVLTIM